MERKQKRTTSRKEHTQYDLRLDVNRLKQQYETKEGDLENFINCIEILTTENQTTKAEFMENFEWILDVGGFRLITTTFKSLNDYKQDYFIINALRQKSSFLEGLMKNYENIKKRAESLDSNIQSYLDNQ